jgi:PAS domain S-box-containing protein
MTDANRTAHILVVDDDMALRRLTVALLTSAGYAATPAADGAEALRLAAEQQPDLALLDVGLPDINGMEMCRRLKADPATADIFVILFSSTDADAASQVAGLEGGADGYIARPISDRELVARVDALLRIKRAEAALRQANAQLQAELAARRQVEEALRRNEQRQRELVDLAQEGIWAIDAEARTTYVNPRMAEMLGYAADEMLGRSLYDFADAAGRQSISHNIERRKRGIREQLDFRFLRKDGTPIETLVSTAPLLDATGAYTGAIAVITDMTDRQHAEAQLRRERNLLRTLIDNMPDFIYIKDAEARFLIANHALARLVGVASPADLLGKSDRDFFPPDLAERYLADDLAVIRSGRSLIGREEPTLTLSGPLGWLITTKVPVRDEAGQVIGLVGIGRDITARKRAEDERQEMLTRLARSNADLEQFAYVASHDLQEPLRMVASFVGLLKERYQGQLDADADEFIEFAVDGARRMQALINDLLEFSRVSTRGQPFEPTDCNRIFRQTIHDLQLVIEDHAAVVTSDPLPTVLADRAQMGQLFLNLIGNAIKYHSDRPPVVHVSAELRNADFGFRNEGQSPQSAIRNPQWVFSVRDNGIGIDPQDHGRIFGLFQRLHGRGEYEGAGIGLAICKKIVERHGGRIWVASALGQGSTFYFTIPQREETDFGSLAVLHQE